MIARRHRVLENGLQLITILSFLAATATTNYLIQVQIAVLLSIVLRLARVVEVKHAHGAERIDILLSHPVVVAGADDSRS